MRTSALLLFLSLLPAMPALAQSSARVGVGAAAAFFEATGEGIEDSVRITPLVRVRRNGWAPALAFNWFATEVSPKTSSIQAARGDLTVRPVMAGVSYTFSHARLATSVGVVGGYALNGIAAIEQGGGQPVELRVENSVAWAPTATLAVDLTRRLGLLTQVGYVVARPTVTARVGGVEDRSRWKADSLVLQVGAVVGLF